MINPEQITIFGAIETFESLSTDALVRLNLKMNNGNLELLKADKAYSKIKHLVNNGKFHSLVDTAFQQVIANRIQEEKVQLLPEPSSFPKIEKHQPFEFEKEIKSHDELTPEAQQMINMIKEFVARNSSWIDSIIKDEE